MGREQNIPWSVKTWRLARGEKGADSKWSPLHFIIRKDLVGQSNDQPLGRQRREVFMLN